MTTTTQLVTGVDFVPFSTQDIDTAMDFYGGKLGLPRSVHIPERNYAEFETGNVTLSIVVGEAMGIGHNVNRIALALHVDDVAEGGDGLAPHLADAVMADVHRSRVQGRTAHVREIPNDVLGVELEGRHVVTPGDRVIDPAHELDVRPRHSQQIQRSPGQGVVVRFTNGW